MIGHFNVVEVPLANIDSCDIMLEKSFKMISCGSVWTIFTRMNVSLKGSM